MDNTLVRLLRRALVLYVVTVLGHYIPYSPGKGGLTINNNIPVETDSFIWFHLPAAHGLPFRLNFC